MDGSNPKEVGARSYLDNVYLLVPKQVYLIIYVPHTPDMCTPPSNLQALGILN